jgi:adenylosuccinate lyase
VLDYIHSEWEDDHRQGETAWSFAPEVCLLMGAQLALCKRLLGSLVVKPENMLRNLDRSGGVVLSEAVMMALARRIGRDRAHALVLEIARVAAKEKTPFGKAVRAHPDVRRILKPREIDAVLQYRNSLGLSAFFVDQVLKAHEKARRDPRTRP